MSDLSGYFPAAAALSPLPPPLTFPLPPFFQLLIPLLRLGANNGYWVPRARRRDGEDRAGEREGERERAVQTMRRFIFTTVSQLSSAQLGALFPINQSDSAAARIFWKAFCRLFRIYPPPTE